MTEYFLLIKALHIISFTSWMAGMFYLPRLFVYHASAQVGSELSETLKVMERKLLRIIINPAMIATFIFGIILIIITKPTGMWFHSKMLLVIFMTAIHGYLAVCRKKFAADANTRSAKFYRILNEAPTVLFIIIVLLVVLKGF